MPPPDRWGDYSPVGLVIEGTRILCCKVPLKYGLVRQLPEEERFTPEELIKRVSSQGYTLGLVVDLTFTKKYYNSNEFTGREVQYEKIFTKGHEVPSDEVYSRFADTLNNFLAENKDNSSVAVHCTHGVNRTGYLVCRYLIETCDMSPDDAIQAFNTARGHNVERVNYLEDLRTRIPGEVTVYEGPVSSYDGEQSASAGPSRFPRPGAKVENSYSKLKEQHASFQAGWQQRDRDYEMRNRRNQEDNWHRRNEGGHRGRNAYSQDNHSWEEKNFRDTGNRYTDRRRHDSRQSYYDNQWEDYNSYGQGYQGHYANSGGRFSRDYYSQNMNGHHHDARSGRGGNRYGGNRGYENRHGGNRGYENRWGQAGPSEYNSPLRYDDWCDNRSRYDNSGWGGQDRRPRHRGGRGRR